MPKLSNSDKRDAVRRNERGRSSERSPALVSVLQHTRARFNARATKQLVDELLELTPTEALHVCQTMLLAQAFEERRLLEWWNKAKDPTRKDSIFAYLKETRRSGKHLKGMLDGVIRAAKVVEQLDLDSAPSEVKVTGAGAAVRSHLTAV